MRVPCRPSGNVLLSRFLIRTRGVGCDNLCVHVCNTRAGHYEIYRIGSTRYMQATRRQHKLATVKNFERWAVFPTTDCRTITTEFRYLQWSETRRRLMIRVSPQTPEKVAIALSIGCPDKRCPCFEFRQHCVNLQYYLPSTDRW